MAPRPRLRHADVEHTVETRCPAGHAQVLRCHPLRRGGARFDPFPTLFWLACPQLTEALSRLEHEGWIKRLSERLVTDPALRAAVERDHDAYIAERWSRLSPEEQDEIRRRGLEGEFTQRGVGGIRNRASVKCLHLHYAHHLARGTALGAILDELGVLHPCAAPPAG